MYLVVLIQQFVPHFYLLYPNIVRNIKYYLDVEKQSKSQEYEKFQSFIKGYGQILDIVGKEDIEIIKINQIT